MSKEPKLDFNFRYRPKVDSPDAILIKYLQSYKPIERKHLILKALRAFYLVAAYGYCGNFDDHQQLENFVRQLRETYGEDSKKDEHDLSIDISLSIGVNSYTSLSSLPSSDDDEDDDDWD